MSPLWLALWAAADKGLPLMYGVTLIFGPIRVLSKVEWGAWTFFQMIFMIITLVGDFFILQPMVKIASEHDSDERPVITASMLLYTLFTLLLGYGITLFASPFAAIFKTPEAATALEFMGLLVFSTIVRNISIRVLQIDYRIISIFLVDLAYFGGVIALMILGTLDGSFRTAIDFIYYNLYAFAASSILGLILAARRMMPTVDGFAHAARRVFELGLHQGGTGILTVVQQQGDLVIITGMRGGVTAGIYNAARSFYRIYEAIRDGAQLLLVPATSRAYSQEKIEAVEEVTELSTAAMVALLVPMSAVLIALAPVIIPVVLPQYPDAVPEFQWLMASGFAMPFVIVPSAVLLGIGHTRDLFRGTLIGTVVLVLGGMVLTWFQGSVGMAQAVFLGTTVTAILLTRRMNRYVPFTFRTVLRRSRSFGPMARKRLATLGKGRSQKSSAEG